MRIFFVLCMKRDVSLLILVAAFVVVTAIAVHYLTREQIGLSPADDSGGGDAPPSGEPSFQRLTFIPQCDDGIDNDNDGEIDYPDDSGCDNLDENSEQLTKVGIMYSLWHCPISPYYTNDIYDVSEILAGRQEWGPIPAFHWWDKPKRGYYCLSIDDNIIVEHAVMLREAGIDFVYLDVTNWPWADERVNARRSIMEPYNNMLEVWSTVPNAPKIVPWAPLTSDSTMMDYLLERLNEYPNMLFIYRGKPLVLVVDNLGFPPDEERIELLTERYTVRKMWGLLLQTTDPSTWSGLEPCQEGFKESQGTIDCNQRVAYYNGQVEQVGIATAYQRDYISNIVTAVPKFYGRTFVKQFETLFDYSEVPIATVGTWNEWMAQRFCFDEFGQFTANPENCFLEQFPNGARIFVDQYDIEYNKDIEPADNEMGDFYYQLMKQCITLYKQGESCDPICGNGIVESPEECDDGNRNEDDQCSNECTWTYCGDLIVQQPNGNPPPGVGFVEECDGTGTFCGNLFPGWNCLGIAECNPQNTVNQCEYDISNCNCSPPPPPQPPVCGNNVCEPGETCENCEQDCGVICGWVFRCDDRTGLQRFCRFFRQ